MSYEYGGEGYEETYSARNQIDNGVAAGVDEQELIEKAGVTAKDLYLTRAPAKEILDQLDPIYISYFVPGTAWSMLCLPEAAGFMI